MYQQSHHQQTTSSTTEAPSQSSVVDFGSNAARQEQLSAGEDGASSASSPGWFDDILHNLDPDAYELEQLLEKERLSTEEVARARELIAAMPPWSQEEYYLLLQEKTAYYNQRDNESTQEKASGGTCNFTAIAMALEMLGVPNPDPSRSFEDALIKRAEEMGLRLTKRDSWRDVVATLDPPVDLIPVFEVWGKPLSREQWESIRDDHLSKGRGVVLAHSGHVVRLQSVTAEGVIVDDPYGAMPIKRGGGLRWGARTDDGGSVKNERDTGTGPGGTKGNDTVYPWADLQGFPINAVYALDIGGASGSPFKFIKKRPTDGSGAPWGMG